MDPRRIDLRPPVNLSPDDSLEVKVELTVHNNTEERRTIVAVEYRPVLADPQP